MNDLAVILVIDDEAAIQKLLEAALSAENYKLFTAATGKEGIHAAASRNPDLILLDLGLPDIDGLEVLKQLREWNQSPIIVLSARGQDSDKITALDNGANDYLTKPFSVGELLARVRVALRLAQKDKPEEASISFDKITIDFAARRVLKAGEEVHLTPNEFKLLAVLARNAGRVLTHRQLLEHVWGHAYAGQVQYLRVFMAQLRSKLEEHAARPKYFITEPGVGYRLRIE